MYEGKIFWDGSIPLIQNRDKFIEWLKQFPEGQWISFECSPIGSINNTDQSKLYFSWCTLLASELGWSSGTEIHNHFKSEFNNGKTTKGFTEKQWSEYMNKVLAFAGDLGIILPLKTD